MSGFVYFLGADAPSFVKIGYSRWPIERLDVYRTWSPVPVTLLCTVPGTLKIERNIQDCFADYHSHHEWFRRGPRLDRAIRALIAGVPLDVAVDLADRRGNVLGNIQRATMERNGTKPGWSRPAALERKAS